jgi:FkbM family methyltransferase
MRDNRSLRLMLSSLLDEDSNCIDIEAYRGDVFAEFVRLAPRGRHIAFEPLPEFHRLLIDRFPGYDVRCAAVSNFTGTAPFTEVPSFAGL